MELVASVVVNSVSVVSLCDDETWVKWISGASEDVMTPEAVTVTFDVVSFGDGELNW